MATQTIERPEKTEEEIAMIKRILETKKKIKELAKTQKEEKALLHMPHNKIPTIKMKLNNGYEITEGGLGRAGRLMNNTRDRAQTITTLHIQYNSLRGKPYDMHAYHMER